MLVIIGSIIHSLYRDTVSILQQAAIVVKNGKIETVEELKTDSQKCSLKQLYPNATFINLEDGQFLIPGFIDTHIHAPQFPNAGLGYDKPLLDWLTSYTFPLEKEYEDVEFAARVYKSVVEKTLAFGTTTAVYFGSVHRESTRVLAQSMIAAGQRGLVGKVNMDQCCIPEMVEQTQSSVAETEQFLKDVFDLEEDLVKPVITPRFAITCSTSLLKELGTLSAKYDLHIQTHLSENKEEIREVQRLFPDSTSYTNVYENAQLLTRKTILAHCVHLSDEEIQVLYRNKCSIAHCPNSNIMIHSGLCDVRRLLDSKLNVSLGTDVAGGSTPSMLDAIRTALNTSVCISFAKPSYKVLSYHEAFYMATMGGAVALGMEDVLGNFAPGKLFDALIVSTKFVDSPIQVLSNLSVSELFQKFIYTGDDRNICKVFVNGKMVVNKERIG